MTAPRRGYQQVAEIFHTEPLIMSKAVLPGGTSLVTHGTDEYINSQRLVELVAALMEGCYQ